jgi:hypothetical protein
MRLCIAGFAGFATATAIAAGLALASPLTAAPAASHQGFLYGTVETKSGGRYTGLLRWGKEEAFWDDLFNASKRDQPATGKLPRGYRREAQKIEVFGLEITGPWERGWATRQFVARFGDIVEIRPRGGDRVEVEMKGGQVHELDGGSNDVGATVRVLDATLGEVKVEWERIRSIRFAATPADVRPQGQRLRAVVQTAAGEFRGHLQWDSEEALTGDLLDGETDDGDLSIEMGRIRSIERDGRSASRVTLVDGRVLEMSGSNDVDSSIRGVLVADERFGRVEIPWDAFRRAEIEAAPDSGRGYDDYPAGRPLEAKVTAADGRSRSGRIAFDLDETASWELLNGVGDDVEYSIVFADVKSIRPLGRKRAEVELRNGQKLTLEGQTDVSESNAGVAFLGPEKVEGAPDYLPWDEITAIELR